MSKREAVTCITSRAFVVLFWVAVILSLLYLPHAKQLFYNPRRINVYTWADMLDPESVADFQKQTGIQVNLSYYDNNEELLTKLRITQGRGYDLIVASDYGIPELLKLGMLKKIDKSKLTFWSELDTRLLGHYYDPANEYSIPFYWDVYGLGVDVHAFGGKLPKPSWRLIFDPKVAKHHIGMLDDGFEAAMIASQYLFGNTVERLTQQQLKKIEELLIGQKKLVAVYTDLRADYLLVSKTSPLVVSQAAYIYRAMTENEYIKFLIPDEGSFLIFDTLVRPKASTKDEEVYQFINFLYQKKIVKQFVEELAFLPVRKDVLEEMDLNYLGGRDAFLDPERFKRFSFFRPLAPMQDIGKLWINVKAS